jgi:hypothetical protein
MFPSTAKVEVLKDLGEITYGMEVAGGREKRHN